ncbi:NACHT domain-containing protein [Nocardia sp. NPDC050718]|uniref:NACHT domain-containing protein n=1 Tax=Nocardia sp. NPDC050718 TaxID=3155788 RepID=UPI0033DBCFC1
MLPFYVEELSEIVAQVELRRLGELGLVRHEGVEVRWNEHNGRNFVGSGEFGSPRAVSTYFSELQTSRIMFIGESGAGKTVAAMNLLLDLIDRRRESESPYDPVPVRVNASGWDPGSCSFSEFVARRISDDYSIRVNIARKLVGSLRIMPILDGLDEMDDDSPDPHRARAALDELNSVEWRGRPVVVTCRSDSFHRIRSLRGNGTGLRDARTIDIRPLAAAQIARYIADYGADFVAEGDSWSGIREKIETEPSGVLAQSMRTPWMLTMTVNLLSSSDVVKVKELVEATDRDVVENILFSELVPAAVASIPRDSHGNKMYSEDQVLIWLATLARHLGVNRSYGRGNSIALDGLWMIAKSRTCRALHGILSACVAFISALPLAVYLTWLEALFAAALCAVVCGIRGAWPVQLRAHKVIWRTRKRGERIARRWLVGGLYGGLSAAAVGVCVGLTYEEPNEFAGLSDPLSVVEMAIMWSGVVGLSVFLAVSLTAHRRPNLDERRLIREDVLAGLQIGLFSWISLGVVIFLLALPRLEAKVALASLAVAPLSVLAMTIVASPMGVLIVALIMLARSKASIRFLSAKLVFAASGEFSSAPGPFLNWARDVGLLRVTGAAYQFRHETYRRWISMLSG